MKKDKSMKTIWIIFGLICVLIIGSYFAYTFWIQPNEPVKEMQDYTWQQVAYIGVLLLGIAAILRSINPTINIYNNSKGRVTKSNG
jgi:O-antigen/teichoic acid export membrane protein